MIFRRVLPLIVLASLGPAVFGCAETEPYLHNTAEFNRDAPKFGKEPKNIRSVAICYGKQSTTAQELREMADARCGQFGKVARFKSQDYLQCPLITPARAVFACVKE